MAGVVLDKYETVKKLMEQTATETGLTGVVRLSLKEYQKGV